VVQAVCRRPYTAESRFRSQVRPCEICGIIILNYTLQPFKAYCAILVRRSNFLHQASPRVSPRESTQRRKVELWARNVRQFCLNADFHVTFRNLLHAVKLRHGTDGFTSPPKEGVLRIFFRPKNPTASAGCEPANLGTKGQHATSRPPKPLRFVVDKVTFWQVSPPPPLPVFPCQCHSTIAPYSLWVKDRARRHQWA
jgi:hypothetical protein